MASYERKKTLTMNWAALGHHDDDEENFFETRDRMSSAVPLDLAFNYDSDNDDDFEDSRMSFASVASSTEFQNYVAMPSTTENRNFTTIPSLTGYRHFAGLPPASMISGGAMSPGFDIWMAAPGSITERRKRLLQGMGLAEGENQEMNSIATGLASRGVNMNDHVSVSRDVMNVDNGKKDSRQESETQHEPGPGPGPGPGPETPQNLPSKLVRSRSDSDIEAFSVDKKRKEEVIGSMSKQRLTRTSSMIIVSKARVCPIQETLKNSPKNGQGGQPVKHKQAYMPVVPTSQFGAFFLIKNLDTGKEFIVNEYNEDGMWNRLSDLQTGKQLTMEEFEKCVGHSPVVKELMRRENGSGENGDGYRKHSFYSKSLRMSKKTGAALLKNIKGVACSMSMSKGDKDREIPTQAPADTKPGKNSVPAAAAAAGGQSSTVSGWVKVRQTGKTFKELSALHLCQEIEAHEGSIWTMKFSHDTRYLASGGEDKVIHIWEVQECEIMSLPEGNFTPLHQSLAGSTTPGLGEVTPMPSGKEKKSKKNKKEAQAPRKENQIPDYVHVPETVFSLSEKPVCSFSGHLDDILDLSWSRSQQLLSSSMDKTVRLWDIETGSCLKLFAHNDYVTCIQFNPLDDNYFISGSLDSKVRIWNVPNRQLVDWTDVYEMITAACYTPDGQGAIIGSHKGNCRLYTAKDNKLNEADQFEVQMKKKKVAKKVTGFQFSPVNPAEVLVTSADSRIRILDGKDMVHKFMGFKNLNSQISATFSLDGKYVISASEDSNVYIWRREENRAAPPKGKGHINTPAFESFQCKDVSVAIVWPGTVKGDPPSVQVGGSKRHSRKSSTLQAPSSPTKEDAASASKRHLAPSSVPDSPPKEEVSSQAANTKSKLPPLPKKNNNAEKNNNVEKEPASEEDPAAISGSNSSGGGSLANSASLRRGDSPSMSSANPSTWGSSWSWFDGTGQGNQAIQPTAWGIVIVTATLSGEIRAYQNFGLPRRLGRQSNLF